MQDFVHLDVTHTLAEISYYDDLSTVWGGHDVDHECDAFWLSGWRIDSCTDAEVTNGPIFVSSWTEGEFHNVFCPGGCARTHRGTFYGTPGKNLHWYCDFYDEDPVAGLHWSCHGGATATEQ